MQETLQHHHNFNPRPLAGATIGLDNYRKYCRISIHAPSRGRRQFHIHAVNAIVISIHAPSRGRQANAGNLATSPQFQSTPPRGGDLLQHVAPEPWGNFNPRPLAGATNGATGGEANVTLFQSTPPRGGDSCCAPGLPGSRYFNPRPLAGATSGESQGRQGRPISIHAPSRGRPCLLLRRPSAH